MAMTLYGIIDLIFRGLSFLIFARVILSWIPHDPHNKLVGTLYQVTDPILRPLQGIVPPSRMGGLDISPIIALFLLNFLKGAVVTLLVR
ncbi:MAG: YggT family protein [Candidatus Margulisiibacteriota bacterium]